MKKLFSLLVLGCIFLSCSPYTLLEGSVLNNANFNNYKTYRIAPPDDKLPRYLSQTDYVNIVNAIRHQMDIRGFKENATSPLLINMAITIRDNIQTKEAIPPSAPVFMGARASYWRNYYSDAKLITDISKEGILMIDMVDERDNRYLYTAAVGNVVDKADHKVKDITQLNKAVADLFKKFPIPAIKE